MKLFRVTPDTDPGFDRLSRIATSWRETGVMPTEVGVLSESEQVTVYLAAGEFEAPMVISMGLEWCWKRLNSVQRRVIEEIDPTTHSYLTHHYGAEVYYR